jgi:hypothetical protein
MTEVTVLIGAGSIGLAIARRVSAGRHVLAADLLEEFGNVIATDGSAVVIASQSGHRLGRPTSSRETIRRSRLPGDRARLVHLRKRLSSRSP